MLVDPPGGQLGLRLPASIELPPYDEPPGWPLAGREGLPQSPGDHAGAHLQPQGVLSEQQVPGGILIGGRPALHR
eukprot:15464406-Alexandrium_andersonii.AAC.1